MSIPIDDVTVPGWNFDAWPANSMVTLVNVPWSNTYRDVVRFADRGALNQYIDSRVNEPADIISQMSYIPTNKPIRLSDPENRLYRYNYLRVSNPTIPGTRDYKRDYYYFITDIQFVNGGMSYVTVQLDVFQTFIYDVTFGNCYVERGHVAIANTNRFNNHGRDYLTVAEGMETGSNYVNVNQFKESVMSAAECDYLVCSTVALQGGNFGTPSNPQLNMASGGRMQGVYSGATYYIVRGADLNTFMGALARYPWAAQGIISMTAIPPITRFAPNYNYGTGEIPIALAPNVMNSSRSYDIFPSSRPESDWRQVIRESMNPRYRGLDKFLTAPYSYVELTTMNGTPLQLRPEAWDTDRLDVVETISLPLPNQRISIYPDGYNAYGMYGPGDEYDRATGVTNLPQVAIVNDAAAVTLASQAHSIAYSQDAADWSQQKALRGNALSYDQSAAGSALQNNLMGINQSAERAQLANRSQWNNNDAWASTGKNAVGAAVGGAAVGGPAGALIGGLGGLGAGVAGQIQTAVGGRRDAESLALSQGAQTMGNMLTQLNDRGVRDTNKSLSDWAAKGDYENTVAGINAKVQDTQLTPPSVVGQMGGEMFNFATSGEGQEITARLKRIDDAHVSMIGEYWLRYGYSVNRFMRPPSDLNVMSKFTYWKMSETYIGTSPMPETYKQAIRGIFEKGVTVWASPTDIGNTDAATNTARTGVSY